MNYYDDDDEYLDFNPFECGEECPFMRQQFGPGGPPPYGPGSGPGGPPPFGPGGPGGGPGGGQQQGRPPMGPPPKFTPQQSQAKSFGPGGPGGVGAFAVDPGALRPCRFRYTYLWLRNGQQFWSWPTFIGRTSLAGWRWNGRNWVYFGTDLRRIVSFYCR